MSQLQSREYKAKAHEISLAARLDVFIDVAKILEALNAPFGKNAVIRSFNSANCPCETNWAANRHHTWLLEQTPQNSSKGWHSTHPRTSTTRDTEGTPEISAAQPANQNPPRQCDSLGFKAKEQAAGNPNGTKSFNLEQNQSTQGLTGHQGTAFPV